MTDRQSNPSRLRPILFIVSIIVIAVGVLLPESAFDPLALPDPPPTVSGFTLLRIALIAEGVALVIAAALNVRFPRLSPDHRLTVPPPPIFAGDERPYWIALAIITGLGLILRLINLGNDLWVDEIASVRNFATATIPQIYSTYISTNNHLLNTVLMSGVIRFIGDSEWMIRLPAMLFGVAAVPAMYRAARKVFMPAYSVAAALLIAVSYHHIFFSQNARGYTAYMLFALIGSALLVDALRTDRARAWALLIASAVLCIAAHLTGAFVLAGFAVVCVLALIAVALRRVSVAPLLGRLLVVGVILGALILNLYIVIVPQALSIVRDVYTTQSSGYQPFSLEFLVELFRGFTINLNPALIVAAIPALIIAAIGTVSLLRRGWVLILALSLGPLLHFALSATRGLVFSPRFFLVLLFPVILIALESLRLVVEWITRAISGRIKQPHVLPALIGGVGVAAMIVVFVLPLRYYYTVPKQPFTASLAYAESLRDSGQPIIALDLMELGYRFYGTDNPDFTGLMAGRDIYFIRDMAEYEAARAAGGAILVTTLERNARLNNPALYARILTEWTRIETFGGSVGDGQITVWIPTISGE